MRTKRKLLTISRWLGKVPSLGYALIYLLCIPSFAFIYYELPGHFYHSTLSSERSLTTEYEDIRRDLSVLMSKQREKVNPSPDNHIWPPVIEGRPHYWAAYVNRIENLSIEDDSISFILRGNYYAAGVEGKKYNDAFYEKQDIRDFSIPARLSLWGRIREYNGEAYGSESLTLDLPSEIQHLFPDRESQLTFIAALFPEVVFQKPDFGLRVPEKLLNRIRTYSDVKQGTDSTSSGRFVRMLYLSASTITTLGFGDIVPMTTPSRILVSVEAILGIVLIGLFLNALSFERTSVEPSEITSSSPPS